MWISYKQCVTHLNKRFDDLNLTGIHEMPTNICKSYYYPDQPKTNNIEDLLELPPRYYFSFVTKGLEKRTFIKHCCYFDSMLAAEKFKSAVEKAFILKI